MVEVVMKKDNNVTTDLNMTFHLQFHMAISYGLPDFFGYHYCLGQKHLDLQLLCTLSSQLPTFGL